MLDIEQVRAFAEEKLRGFRDWAHSYSHVQAILELLYDFFAHVSVDGVDKDALYKAAILHDIGRLEPGDHAANSVRIMRVLDLENEDKIAQIILEHDYPKWRAHDIQTVEGQILWDVDNLESNGYIGLIRIQEHARYLGKDRDWMVRQFREVWRAEPEHMHFEYTRELMRAKKVEERRYMEVLCPGGEEVTE